MTFVFNCVCLNFVQSNELKEESIIESEQLQERNELTEEQETPSENKVLDEQETQNKISEQQEALNENNFVEEQEAQKEIQTIEVQKDLEQEQTIEVPKETKKEKSTAIQEKGAVLKASQITPFNSKRGYFLIHIKDKEKETIRKINVNLTSLNRGSSQTIYFEETDFSGKTDKHNFQILTTSVKTKATEQNSYALFSFQFSYTKPAHLKASHWYSDKTGNERFNFNKSPTDTTTTINNTGHNAYDTTEIINMQINLANCGIAALEVTPKNATGHIELNKDYYSGLIIDPNGGVHDGKNYQYNYGTKCCVTEVTINNPTRNGYAFIGWTFTRGNNCGYALFDKNTSKFKYCGKSSSSSNAGNDNTCTLKAEWIKNNDKYVLPQAGAKINIGIIFSWLRNRNYNYCDKK